MCLLNSAEGQTVESLAMKTISVRRKESRELMILQKLNHENIIKLRNFFYIQVPNFLERLFAIICKVVYINDKIRTPHLHFEFKRIENFIISELNKK